VVASIRYYRGVCGGVPNECGFSEFGGDLTTGQFGPMLSANAGIAHWGFAIEYSTLYLTSRFTPGQLPKEEPLHQFVPLVEFAF
jgi:hypothetical protein